MRENVTKPDNNRAWHYVIAPLVHFSFPWFFLIFAGLLKFYKTKLQNKNLLYLAIAFALPTLLFWATWQYKGQNYNLPAITALCIFGIVTLDFELPRWPFQIMGTIGFIAMFAMLALIYNFFPLPGWWKVLR